MNEVRMSIVSSAGDDSYAERRLAMMMMMVKTGRVANNETRWCHAHFSCFSPVKDPAPCSICTIPPG